MPVKCCFCSELGHSIQTCQSETAGVLFQSFKQSARDSLSQNLDMIQKSFHLYNYIFRHFKMNELKMIMIMIRRESDELFRRYPLDYGTRKQKLASAIIYFYFYKTLLDSETNNIPDLLQRRLIHFNTHFWKSVSIGSIREVSINSYNSHYMNMSLRINQAISIATARTQTQTPIEKFQILFEIIPFDLTEDHFECSICMEDECSPFEKVVMNCNHSFCKNCVHQVLTDAKSKRKHPSCALCRQNFSKIQICDQNILNDFERLI